MRHVTRWPAASEILVKVTVDATDGAGNRGGATVATIRPKR